MTTVGDPRWRQVWRLHYRFTDGRTEGVDAYGLSPQWGWTASDAARAEMRRRYGPNGYWMEAWQQLMVPVGRWDAKRNELRIDGPPRRFRRWFR